ncbi:MAG: MFS transporter [Chloroflexi bacterium]|nr:MFS transporter [Chloroflexota bacterium]
MSERKTPLSIQLAVISLARLLVNTGLRLAYPFAPALARGLGVELTAVYRLIAIRNFSGFTGPLFGPLSGRYGRRAVMVGAVVFFSGGAALVALWPAYWPLGAALIIISLSKVAYDPAMQSYIGDIVPYAKRGQAIAATEYSWAGALLIGGPAVSLAIQRWGWQAPFVGLAILGVVAAVVLRRTLPPATSRRQQTADLREIWRVVRRHPVIWAAAAFTTLAMAANENLFIVYGDWMETSFGLALTSLGLASGVIGGAEMSGEIFVGWAVDRFGKRPIIIAGGLLNAAVFAAIPFISVTLTSALATLFVLFFTYEITVVGSVPLLTEIVPHDRGVVMSINVAAFALGRALGALIGPFIASRAGFMGNGLTAAGLMLAAVFILALWVKEGE